MKAFSKEKAVEVALDASWVDATRTKEVDDAYVYIPFGNTEAIRGSARYAPMRELIDICIGHRFELVGSTWDYDHYNVWLIVAPDDSVRMEIEFPFALGNKYSGDPYVGVDEVSLELTPAERNLILDTAHKARYNKYIPAV